MSIKGKRILAVDPGEKRIGIAFSETGVLASPLIVIKHASMIIDAAQIVNLAEEKKTELIIVGVPTGSQGDEIPQTRHARKLIEAIQNQTTIMVTGWDEWGSTQEARRLLIESGKQRTKRTGHQDALAATVILRSYIESHEGSENDHG